MSAPGGAQSEPGLVNDISGGVLYKRGISVSFGQVLTKKIIRAIWGVLGFGGNGLFLKENSYDLSLNATAESVSQFKVHINFR